MRETAYALGWTPDAFWRAIAIDVAAGVRGYNRREGGQPADRAPSRQDLDEMMKRFPD